jgi:hypothetical protein
MELLQQLAEVLLGGRKEDIAVVEIKFSALSGGDLLRLGGRSQKKERAHGRRQKRMEKGQKKIKLNVSGTPGI